jgi:hypothetical protein
MVDRSFDPSLDTVAPGGAAPRSYVEWGPIVAGAVSAAAIAFVLLTFGSAIGLSAASPWPNAGLPVWLVAIIGAVWLLVVQAGSYALGGYLAGRMRAPATMVRTEERQFRDGAHGFFVWALGVTISAVVVALTAGSVARTGSELASGAVEGVAQLAPAATTVAADGPSAYAIDRLLRAPPAPSNGAQNSTAPADQNLSAEVARVFASGLRGDALAQDDRAYLTRVVAARTGASEAEAQTQVDQAFTLAQEAERAARDAADKARKASAIGAFLIAASLLVSAAAAAAGAGLGGRHRDENGELRFLGRQRFW